MRLLLTTAAVALVLAAGPLAAADDAASRKAAAQAPPPAAPAAERSGSWFDWDWAALWRRIAEATADGGEIGARYVALANRLPESQEPAPRSGNDAPRR